LGDDVEDEDEDDEKRREEDDDGGADRPRGGKERPRSLLRLERRLPSPMEPKPSTAAACSRAMETADINARQERSLFLRANGG
jgi:hypothetical protein